MNRRAELEIVINTRWVERGFWLLIIAAVAAFFLWQDASAERQGAAEDLARIAELENQLIQKDDDLSALRVENGLLAARIDDLDALLEAKEQQTTGTTTPTPAPVEGMLNAAWTFEGEDVSENQYRLSSVTVYATNTYAEPKLLRYEFCWSLIDCENVVTRGSFTARANGDTTHEATVTIPRFVDSTVSQRLKLTVYDGERVIHTSERVIS